MVSLAKQNVGEKQVNERRRRKRRYEKGKMFLGFMGEAEGKIIMEEIRVENSMYMYI